MNLAERYEHIQRLLTEIENTASGIEKTFQYQLLGNADNIWTRVTNEEEQKVVQLLLEEMIKKPFRRQVGRLRSVLRLKQEITKHLELIHVEQTSHDGTHAAD